jgi:ATP-dependent RNA helicase DeaD
VEDVDAVINYDVPTSNEYYIHRIGRTARAGKEGESYILYAPDEDKHLRQMIRLTRSTVIPMRFDDDRKLIEAES